jgi:3-carboxy-cis,cis-muconate cycloisomerase
MTFSDGSGLTGALFVDAGMAAALSDRSWLEGMLLFEAALARAEAECGVIPARAAELIAMCCDASQFDLGELGRRTTLAGNPAIPLVAMLTDLVRNRDPDAAEFVHFGATSQDVIDTALGLILEDATVIVLDRLAASCHALAGLARQHRRTPMVGRTLLQHALPISFGHKCALWLDGLLMSHDNLMSRTANWLQFGGAAGTLASLGDKADAVHAALGAQPLRQRRGAAKAFAQPPFAWHSNRSHLQLVACQFGILAQSMGKIARDIVLMMQTEVAEVFEAAAPGKGGSSTLPHKRNPVQTTAILAAATRAPGLVATLLSAGVHEHERAAGNWHAEWDTLRELVALVGTAALHLQELLTGLDVNSDRMRQNLDMTQGLILSERVVFALAPTIGKAKAKSLIEQACKQAIAEKRHLKDVLSGLAEARDIDLETLFDPASYLGTSDLVIDRVLDLYDAEKKYMVQPSR